MLFSLLTHIPLLSLNETNIMSIGNSSISKTAINIDMRYLSQHLSSCVPTRNTSNQTTASIIKNVPNLLFTCSKHETRTKQLYDRKVKYCFYIFSDKTDNVSTLWRSLLIPAAFSGVNATSTPVVIPDVFWGIFTKHCRYLLNPFEYDGSGSEKASDEVVIQRNTSDWSITLV